MAINRLQLVTIDGVQTDCAGLTVWWGLCKLIQCSRLSTAWQLAGLPMDVLPPPPSPTAVLCRTMNQLFQDRSTLVKPVSGKEGSYAVLPKGSDGSNNPEYTTSWTASIKKLPVTKPGVPPEEELVIDSRCPSKAADQLEIMFDSNMGTYGSIEQSQLMTNVVRWLRGARLHQGGKLYFLPPDKVADWRRVEATLKQSTRIELFEIPALPAQSAMKAVLHAIKQEAEDAAIELEEDVASSAGKATRPATLQRRRDAAKEMRDKLTYYEGFLGQEMTALKDRLEAIELAKVKADILEAF